MVNSVMNPTITYDQYLEQIQEYLDKHGRDVDPEALFLFSTSIPNKTPGSIQQTTAHIGNTYVVAWILCISPGEYRVFASSPEAEGARMLRGLSDPNADNKILTAQKIQQMHDILQLQPGAFDTLKEIQNILDDAKNQVNQITGIDHDLLHRNDAEDSS